MLPYQYPRRWSRQSVNLPVHVALRFDRATLLVPGRGTDMSEGGMALVAGIPARPGDVVEVDFQTPRLAKVRGIIRNRDGFSFGVEFLKPLG
jgi:hypothetical protein